MLAGKAGEAHLAFRAMAVFFVQPGEFRDRQLGALAGRGAEKDRAVAQVEVIELTQEKFVDAAGSEAVFLFIAGEKRTVAVEAQLPEGEIAKLPAPVKQRLPDIQRQRDARDVELAVRLHIDAQIADLQSRPEGFPTAAQRVGSHADPAGARHRRQNFAAVGVEVRHRQTQPADQQRHDHNRGRNQQ